VVKVQALPFAPGILVSSLIAQPQNSTGFQTLHFVLDLAAYNFPVLQWPVASLQMSTFYSDGNSVMRILALFVLIALSVHLPANAGESVLTISDELGKKEIKELLDPNVAMFWGDQAPPTGLAEPSRPEIFSGIEANAIPFAGGVRHCQAAFRKSLNNMLEDARKMHYDVIYAVRSVVQGVPSSDPQRAVCSHVVHVTSLKFQAVLARTPAMATRVAEAELLAVKEAAASARQPSAKIRYLPLQPILDSPEAQAILGSGITWQVGSTAVPASATQLGPIESEGEGNVKKSGETGACKVAVLDALSGLAKDARERGYSGLTKIHSYFDEKRTPVESDVECEISGSDAQVLLRSVLTGAN
jgi:hypothetical protein